MDDRLTTAERDARDRQRQRTRFALRHPSPLIVDWRLARDRAYLDAHDVHIIDWTSIAHASEHDVRWDEPPPRTVRTFSAQRSWRTGGRVSRYVIALVEGEFNAVAGAAPGDRNRLLNTASFRVGQCVGASLVDESRAQAVLELAAQQCGLGHLETQSTIRSGLRAGARHPLEI
jgi:hypothetical protein